MRKNWLRVLIHIGAWVPLAWLAIQYLQGAFLVDPIREMTTHTGKTALVLLVLSLACTPISTVTGLKQVLRVRRALGLYAFGMNYGGVTFRIYLIPSYLIFAVFLGCGLSALRRWLRGLLQGRSLWLAGPLSLALAIVILAMPLYPMWQNWAEADESDNTHYRDIARDFVEHAGPSFVLVDSEAYYDDLEAILYVAWAEKEWYAAHWIPPGEIERWLGARPVYAWQDSAAYHSPYMEETVPELPGMVRIVGVKTEK